MIGAVEDMYCTPDGVRSMKLQKPGAGDTNSVKNTERIEHGVMLTVGAEAVEAVRR